MQNRKFEPKEIDFKRVENIKSLLEDEKLTQAKLADMIGMTPENLNRILRLRHPLTTATAESIYHAFNKKYRLEWIQGYSPYKTDEELARSKDTSIRLSAPITVLDTALKKVCQREGILAPLLDNIPELMLLEAQLNDYAEMLMSGYIHRENSNVWRFLDQIDSKNM